MEIIKTVEKISETKSWLFDKINKIDNLQPDSSSEKKREV